MAKIACCYNCAYAYLDPEHTIECVSLGVLNWPACANHPESYGRMRRVPQRGICVNYRAKAAKPQGNVKQIPLGHGFYAYVDAADYEWLSQWTWHLKDGYAIRLEKRKHVYMHRQIMQPPKGKIVDHKNRNKLDNTRANLHNVTPRENACNRSKKRGTFSRFRGVSYIKRARKYLAQVYYKGQTSFCGYHRDEIEAARARDYKAIQVLGESAPLNFPGEWPPERRAQVYAEFQASLKREEKKRARGVHGRKVPKEERRKARRKKAKTSKRPRPRRTGRKPRRS